MSTSKTESRHKRKLSIRKRVEGNSERPRLPLFRSAEHIYAQVIDDIARQTLAATSTLDPTLRETTKGLKKKDRAKKVGQRIAELCKQQGIEKVVFDRNGFFYHGRVS